jgi:hypothetical protein
MPTSATPPIVVGAPMRRLAWAEPSVLMVHMIAVSEPAMMAIT